MRSPAHDRNGARSNRAGPPSMTPLSQDPVILLPAIGTLVASQSLAELASSAAKLPEKLFETEQAIVVLQGPDGVLVGGHPSPGSSLEVWARELLGEDVLRGSTSTGRQLAVGIEAREAGVRGVIAVELRSAVDVGLGGRLVELGRLVSTCSDQIVARVRSAQALKDAQTSLAKGLHDLRTPLNSLRLGMHLLEPGLAGQDPAIVQRTHRAVDRMATLVTEMFDALHKN
jgi:signal transduction histidine kinase